MLGAVAVASRAAGHAETAAAQTPSTNPRTRGARGRATSSVTDTAKYRIAHRARNRRTSPRLSSTPEHTSALPAAPSTSASSSRLRPS